MPIYVQRYPRFINVNLWRLYTVAKSRRTCYYSRGYEFFDKGRPLSWEPSNKKNKVLCHRIERAWVAEAIHRELMAIGYK